MRSLPRPAFLVAGAVVAVVLSGCGVAGRALGGGSGGSSEEPSDSPSPAYTYNSDATGEVVGTNCRYDQNANQFKFDISIQNASPDHSFKYSIRIDFSGGDSEWSDDSFGSQYQDVTVAPSKDRKITITQGYELPDDRKSYYGCQVATATKSLAD
ncbi:MAG TPA: hypothetical protein VGN37_21655 [Actinocatenispora sp.]